MSVKLHCYCVFSLYVRYPLDCLKQAQILISSCNGISSSSDELSRSTLFWLTSFYNAECSSFSELSSSETFSGGTTYWFCLKTLQLLWLHKLVLNNKTYWSCLLNYAIILYGEITCTLFMSEVPCDSVLINIYLLGLSPL